MAKSSALPAASGSGEDNAGIKPGELWPPPPSEVAFIRRILHCSISHEQTRLPPLLPLDLFGVEVEADNGGASKNRGTRKSPDRDKHEHSLLRLDHECQMLLALLLRDAVLPWFRKLTPDRQLLSEIHRILGEVVRTVTLRFQDHTTTPFCTSQLYAFLSVELPSLIKNHVESYRAAEERLGTPFAASLPCQTSSERTSSIATLFAASNPHNALLDADTSIKGQINPLYLRALTDSLLLMLLPPEDAAPDTERTIVRDVVVSVLRTVLGKFSRPWFIVQSMNKALDAAGLPDWDVKQKRLLRARSLVKIVDESASSQESSNQSQLPKGGSKSLRAHLSRVLDFLRLIFITIAPHLLRFYLGFFDLKLAGSSKGSTAGAAASSKRAAHLESLELESTIPGFAFDHEAEDVPYPAQARNSVSEGLRPVKLTRAQRAQPSEMTSRMESRTPGGRPWSVWQAAEGENEGAGAENTEENGYRVEGADDDASLLSAAAQSSKRKRERVRPAQVAEGGASQYPPTARSTEKTSGFVQNYVALVRALLLLDRTNVGQAVGAFMNLFTILTASIIER